MAKEIEAKFINISKVEIMRKLEEIGAVKVFDERLLRRCVYNLPIHKEGAWARVRDEVDKVTMTYKRVTSQSLDGVKEYALKLGFIWNDAMFGSADFVYAKVFNVTESWINNQCSILSFEKLPIELTEQNKRN